MSREVDKRTAELLKATASVAATKASSAKPVFSGLLKEFSRIDRKDLDRLAELDRKYANGTALPCLKLDPLEVAVGRFFNRFNHAFDPDKDEEFSALLADIRLRGGNLVPGLVRATPGGALPYELIYGERRLRACIAAGTPFKAEVGEFADDEIVLLHACENQHRVGASVVETALQLQSWLQLLGGSTDEVSRETAERIAGLFGYTSRRHVYRLRRIAEVPLRVLSDVPGIRRLSFRQAMQLAEAWAQDAPAVEARMKSLGSGPERLPKDVIALLVGESDGKKPGPRDSMPVSIRWPTDPEKSAALRARLVQIEKEFGVRLGLPKKGPTA